MAVQMVATHFAATRALRRLKVSDTWVFNVARAIYGYPLGPVAQNFTPRATLTFGVDSGVTNRQT